jgi:toxin CptA
MHSAPSVSYPVGRSRFLGTLLLVGWLAGAAANIGWWLQAQPPSSRLMPVALVLACAGWLAWRNWSRTPEAELSWDGEHWNWAGTPDASNDGVQVGIDFQGHLLLRWGRGPHSRWLWIDRASRPERWDDLRRAVYSRATPQALAGAQPPAAKP